MEGLIKQVKSREPTGSPSEKDIEHAALAVYNGEDTIGQMYTFSRNRIIDVGPTFPFMEALEYLRRTATW